MPKTMTMERLADYLAEQIKQIQALEKEVEEIQFGFNSAYADFKAKHDARLASLTEEAGAQFDALLPALRERILERRRVEEERIEQRRRELRDQEIPQARADADAKWAAARQLAAERVKRNPILDKKEERKKAALAELTARLEALNAEIGRLGRGLGFATHYGRIVKLDRERNQVIGQIEATRQAINELRVEWKERLAADETAEAKLQEEWSALNLRAAELQAELDYLDDEAARQALAQRRAIHAVLDAANDPALYPAGPLYEEIQAMIRLNIQTDNYQRGLGTVAGVIALLRGVRQGHTSFLESVNAILQEQRMHAAYLKKLSVQLPDNVLKFNEQWGPLRKKVQDEARLSKYPLEFVAIVQPALERELAQPAIETMFKALGAELNRATRGWKG